MPNTKIALLTDLHLDLQNTTVNGCDTKTNFINSFQCISNEQPDFLIINGDICNSVGNLDTYIWLKEQLDNIAVSYHVLPGNHDDTNLIDKVFGKDAYTNQNYRKITVKENEILCLDSSLGYISNEQWDWLEESVRLMTSRHIILFMHHPPIIAFSKHMESKYAFTEMRRFEQLAFRYSDKHFYVFAGHYHMERTIIKDNITLFITPSLYVQIHPDHMEFTSYNQPIAGRSIFLNNNCLIHTNIFQIPLA